ncbi:MAG TPA: tetratricopeptide repeat protein [Spirochaetia bacterium]|nr:tetratricopeptide repeat protein [Spirochaetales bacterium]HRS64277.1 tetratricopeptide repeat protein [Spirochaetia bacterium]HOT59532.1 tetratricopeptide repeat protein [Spirochaetales bacterium]HPD80090.1 tetratricopeptide repeat protein [Spirochaetales bacterium]HQK33466.1 tetratricopeptide repeat protein [Spirochaetales bacterium]
MADFNQPPLPFENSFDDSQPEENSQVNEIAELSKKGYALLKENQISEAETFFKQIVDQDPENNYALVGLGDAARKRNAFREAVEYYKKCLIYHPGNNYALFGLADCYKALNQYQKAIEIWEQYLLHDNKNITVLTRIADAYRKVREFRKSKAIYLRVLEMEADNPYALIGLGHLHYDFKEYRDALHYWARMVQIQGENVDIRVLTSIGNCYRKLKQFDMGIPYFEKVLQRDPRNFYALFGLADCYRGINKPAESLRYWNLILDIDPKNKVIITRAGDAYRNMGDYDTALEYYQKALDIEFDLYAVMGKATVARLQGKINDAIESLKKLIEYDLKNYRLYIELAQCYLAINDKYKAIEVLMDFQKQGIRNAHVQELINRINSPNSFDSDDRDL